MTLDEAIAEVKRRIEGGILIDDTSGVEIILQAVVSGELVKLALADHGPTAPGQIDG